MPNKYWNNMTGPNHKGAGGCSNKPKGSGVPTAMPMGTADWPGLPGQTQGKSRSGGTPTTGKLGPFHSKKQGI